MAPRVQARRALCRTQQLSLHLRLQLHHFRYSQLPSALLMLSYFLLLQLHPHRHLSWQYRCPFARRAKRSCKHKYTHDDTVKTKKQIEVNFS